MHSILGILQKLNVKFCDIITKYNRIVGVAYIAHVYDNQYLY